MGYDAELAAAIEAAGQAAEIGLDYFTPARMRTRAKGDRDVVTDADFASERFLLRRLGELFPGDGILGEEGTDRDPNNPRRWCIDPIDGTLNYSRGLPIWCVSLSLFERGIPVVGVIVDPLRGETFAAAKGTGCTANGRPVAVSRLQEMSEALVHITIDFASESMEQGLDDIQNLAPRVLRTRNIGSAALALAYVAAGRFDVMLHRFAHPWDYGAGVLMVEEAGGTVTDMQGNPYTVETVAVVASASPHLGAACRGALGQAVDVSLE